jgi:hypothetical protein
MCTSSTVKSALTAGWLTCALLLLLLVPLQFWLEQSAWHWPDTPQHTHARHGKGSLEVEQVVLLQLP